MMCFAWNQKTPCWDAGMKGGKAETYPRDECVGDCPTIGWFWAVLAGAVALSMGNGKQQGK